VNAPRHFEDWQPGEVLQFGRYEVTAAEIKEFAIEFDPQSFHLDEEAAKDSLFGGLIASGWHSAGIMMRLIVDHGAFVGANIASPGFDDIAWTKPVRPGDVLSVRVEVTRKRRSESKPDRGVVSFRQELLNQDGEIAMSLDSLVLYRCREPGEDAARAEAGGA
jgi:acyl dehydratase